MTIVQMVRLVGQQWTTIARELPGRTDDAVRNRYLRLQKKMSSGKCLTNGSLAQVEKKGDMWTPEEDARMLLGVAKHGYKWHQIAAELHDRSANAVRNRYLRHPNREKLEQALLQGGVSLSDAAMGLSNPILSKLVMSPEPTPSESMAMASFSDMSDLEPDEDADKDDSTSKASSPQLGDSTSSRPCKLSAGMPAPHEGSKRFASVGPHTVHGRDMDDRPSLSRTWAPRLSVLKTSMSRLITMQKVSDEAAGALLEAGETLRSVNGGDNPFLAEGQRLRRLATKKRLLISSTISSSSQHVPSQPVRAQLVRTQPVRAQPLAAQPALAYAQVIAGTVTQPGQTMESLVEEHSAPQSPWTDHEPSLPLPPFLEQICAELSDSAETAAANFSETDGPIAYHQGARLCFQLKGSARPPVADHAAAYSMLPPALAPRGTFGCMLPDRHTGIQRLPEVDASHSKRHKASAPWGIVDQACKEGGPKSGEQTTIAMDSPLDGQHGAQLEAADAASAAVVNVRQAMNFVRRGGSKESTQRRSSQGPSQCYRCRRCGMPKKGHTCDVPDAAGGESNGGHHLGHRSSHGDFEGGVLYGLDDAHLDGSSSLDDEDCDISLLEPIHVTSEELVQLIVPSELQGLSFFCDASSELDCEADGEDLAEALSVDDSLFDPQDWNDDDEA